MTECNHSFRQHPVMPLLHCYKCNRVCSTQEVEQYEAHRAKLKARETALLEHESIIKELWVKAYVASIRNCLPNNDASSKCNHANGVANKAVEDFIRKFGE